MNIKEVAIVNTEQKAIILQYFSVRDLGKKYVSYIDLSIKRQNVIKVGFVFTSTEKTVIFEPKTEDEWTKVAYVVKGLFENKVFDGVEHLSMDPINVIDIVSSKELEIHLPEVDNLMNSLVGDKSSVEESMVDAPSSLDEQKIEEKMKEENIVLQSTQNVESEPETPIEIPITLPPKHENAEPITPPTPVEAISSTPTTTETVNLGSSSTNQEVEAKPLSIDPTQNVTEEANGVNPNNASTANNKTIAMILYVIIGVCVVGTIAVLLLR